MPAGEKMDQAPKARMEP